MRAQRAEAWGAWFKEDWANARKRTYAFVRGEDRTPSCTILQKPDGNLTGHVHEIDEVLRKEWMQTFRLYDSYPPPSWEAFTARYRHLFPGYMPYESPTFTAEMIQEALRHMFNDSFLRG